MVKNGKGGNKGKKIGRKHIGSGGGGLRVRKEEGEMYGVVMRLFGGPNCEVHCEDGKSRLCIIRNKFRGRGKRGNEIRSGIWVMVGAREWEADVPGKLQKCDLLEVYTDADKKKLMSDFPGAWSELVKAEAKTTAAGPTAATTVEDDGIDWADETEDSAAMQEVAEAVAAKGVTNKDVNAIINQFGDVIDIDDI